MVHVERRYVIRLIMSWVLYTHQTFESRTDSLFQSIVCCDIIQLTIDTLYFYTLHIKDPSACWILGFGTSIIFRHSFHRYLVFGDYVGGYWRSLMRMYGGYSIIMVISTIFNIIMTKVFDIPHYTAWAVTLLWTGIVNYFILKHVWSFGGNAEKQRSVELPSRSTQIV